MLTGRVPLDFNELYPRLYPVISFLSRGRLGDWWIFKHYKGAFRAPSNDYPGNPYRFRQGGHSGLVVTKMWYSEQPRTAFQQAWRAYMYWGVKNWQGFDDPTKRYYNDRSKLVGDYGYHRYLSLYLHANYPPAYTIGDLLLLEDGYRILSEANERILIEYYYLLLEDGGFFLQEDGDKIKG
jgi:hypothetical protein